MTAKIGENLSRIEKSTEAHTGLHLTVRAEIVVFLSEHNTDFLLKLQLSILLLKTGHLFNAKSYGEQKL